MSYQLKNISDKDFGAIYELQSGKNLLGRSRSATIRILLDDISGKQCILHSNGLQVKLENLSRFGTRVNNSKVTESVDLVEGDIITLGAKCKLILEKQSAASQAIEEEMLLVGENDPVHDTVIEPSDQPDALSTKSSTDNVSDIEINTSKDSLSNKQPLQSEKTNDAEKSISFVEEEALQEKTLTAAVDEDVTAATRFIGDLPKENTLASEAEEDATAATRFIGDLPKENTLASEAEEDATAATRFIGDLPKENTLASEVEEDATAVTKFVSDLPHDESIAADESNDVTAVTKFESDISDGSDKEESSENDHTAVTRFENDLSIDNKQESDNETAMTKIAEKGDKNLQGNADPDVTLTQFSADIKTKPARRSFWKFLTGLFSSKKKPLSENVENKQDNTDDLLNETLSENQTISSDDKNDKQDLPAGILSENELSDEASFNKSDDSETLATKVESTIAENATMVTAVTMITPSDKNNSETEDIEDKTMEPEESTVIPEKNIDTPSLSNIPDETEDGDTAPSNTENHEEQKLEKSEIKTDEQAATEMISEKEISGSDITEGTDAVKTRPLPIPADLAMIAEESESMEQLEEEIQQKKETEEFFEEEEEDSGDKTNPDPDDIATFFEEEESDSTEKTNINETQMLQTRIASIDEINYIKDQVKRRQQKRFFVRVAVFASIAFALFVIWHLRAPQQESVLSWPMNGQQQAIGLAIPFEKGWKNGGFDIFYPDCGKRTVASKVNENKFEINSFIGKERNVPIKITVIREKSSVILEESRKQSFTRLLTEKMKNKKELFTFDKNSSVIFLGSHNGIMCNVITYQKDYKNKSFWGKLYYFKYGEMAYHLTAEIPFDDKNRAKQLLEDNNFIDISKRFEYLYWEGSSDFRRGDILSRIDEIEDDVRRKSPFQISNLERGIQSILIQASLDNNAKLKEKGLDLLEKLRKNEDELYREYVGKWLLAKATDDIQLKQKIRNVSEGVFSLETDRRRNLILQDIWEYNR